MRVDHVLRVAGLGRTLERLICELQSLDRERRLPDRTVVARERRRECARIANPARDRDRFSSFRAPPSRVSVRTACARDTREQPHSEERIFGSDRLERVLEQRDHRRVGTSATPHESASVPERAASERIRPIAAPSEFRGVRERRLGVGQRACARFGVPQREEQVEACVIQLRRAFGERDRRAQKPDRLLVRQTASGGFACEGRVANDSVDVGDRPRGDVMVRDLAEVSLEIVRA